MYMQKQTDQLHSLLDKIAESFPNFKRNDVRKILILALGVLEKGTVCLNKIKDSISRITGKEKTSPDSHYKALLRIVYKHSSWDAWLKILASVILLLRLKVSHLIIDGTKWEKGTECRHYITLCVIYKGVSIPIYWKDLGKKGISSEEERITFLKEASQIYSLKKKILLADREYVGMQFYKFLISNGIHFIIRIRDRNYIREINSSKGWSYERMRAKVIASKVKTKSIGKAIEIDNAHLYLTISKNQKRSWWRPCRSFDIKPSI